MPSTVAVADAVLSPGVISVGVTVAVLVNVPAVVGVTTIFTVKLSPLVPLAARSPTGQVTVSPAVVHSGKPADGVAETNVTPAGRVSVTRTLVVARLPTLFTVTLKVRLEFTGTESGV